MNDGVDLDAWKSRHDTDWYQDFGPQTERFLGLGLLELSGRRLRLTGKGFPLANEVFCSLL
jgi:coproporphyrinogen III oxidase-like Fe-S oxidoreductase